MKKGLRAKSQGDQTTKIWDVLTLYLLLKTAKRRRKPTSNTPQWENGHHLHNIVVEIMSSRRVRWWGWDPSKVDLCLDSKFSENQRKCVQWWQSINLSFFLFFFLFFFFFFFFFYFTEQLWLQNMYTSAQII